MIGQRSGVLLKANGLSTGYGAGVILDQLYFEIGNSEVVALLGRNGVGKSTFMLALMGHLPARQGTIGWQGKDITQLQPNLRADLGIAWVPQEREIFPSLTVEENIRIASKVGGWSVDGVFDLFPRLKERRHNMGNQLSGGEQQMLAIGRALALNPKLLLLDEPLEGLAPIVAMEVANCIKRLILEGGISVVLVEQHSSFALSLSQRAVVMDRGRVSYDGESEKLLKNPNLLGELIGVAHGVTVEQAEN